MADYEADYNKDGTIDPEEQKKYYLSIGLDETGAPIPGGPQDGRGNGFKTPWGTIRNPFSGLGAESEADKQRRLALAAQGQAAGRFADVGEAGYGAMTAESAAAREAMRRRALGYDSLSAEQLRQGLQQQYAQQRSMAASASPQNQAMAARTGAMQMGRASSAMSGNAAMAGIQERAAAEQALQQSIMAQREQDARVALGSRGNATSAFGAQPSEKSFWDKYGGPITGAAALFASDKRLKTDIKDGDAKAEKILKGLKAHSYKYKDEKYGKGEQYGIMAQDLEKDLGHAVVDTPAGKMVHGPKLAASSLALTAALARRVEKLEKGKK